MTAITPLAGTLAYFTLKQRWDAVSADPSLQDAAARAKAEDERELAQRSYRPVDGPYTLGAAASPLLLHGSGALGGSTATPPRSRAQSVRCQERIASACGGGDSDDAGDTKHDAVQAAIQAAGAAAAAMQRGDRDAVAASWLTSAAAEGRRWHAARQRERENLASLARVSAGTAASALRPRGGGRSVHMQPQLDLPQLVVDGTDDAGSPVLLRGAHPGHGGGSQYSSFASLRQHQAGPRRLSNNTSRSPTPGDTGSGDVTPAANRRRSPHQLQSQLPAATMTDAGSPTSPHGGFFATANNTRPASRATTLGATARTAAANVGSRASAARLRFDDVVGGAVALAGGGGEDVEDVEAEEDKPEFTLDWTRSELFQPTFIPFAAVERRCLTDEWAESHRHAEADRAARTAATLQRARRRQAYKQRHAEQQQQWRAAVAAGTVVVRDGSAPAFSGTAETELRLRGLRAATTTPTAMGGRHGSAGSVRHATGMNGSGPTSPLAASVVSRATVLSGAASLASHSHRDLIYRHPSAATAANGAHMGVGPRAATSMASSPGRLGPMGMAAAYGGRAGDVALPGSPDLAESNTAATTTVPPSASGAPGGGRVSAAQESLLRHSRRRDAVLEEADQEEALLADRLGGRFARPTLREMLDQQDHMMVQARVAAELRQRGTESYAPVLGATRLIHQSSRVEQLLADTRRVLINNRSHAAAGGRQEHIVLPPLVTDDGRVLAPATTVGAPPAA